MRARARRRAVGPPGAPAPEPVDLAAAAGGPDEAPPPSADDDERLLAERPPHHDRGV